MRLWLEGGLPKVQTSQSSRFPCALPPSSSLRSRLESTLDLQEKCKMKTQSFYTSTLTYLIFHNHIIIEARG